MKHIINIIFLFILFQVQNYSQENFISGFLLNAENNKPIIYANVSYLNENIGTVSNKEGFFKINFNSTKISLQFSCIGFQDTIITFNETHENVKIQLREIAYKLNEVIVDPYTFAERFILEAIKVKNRLNTRLNFYQTDVYSKTIFSTDELKIIGIIESVSLINFVRPDKFHEKLLALKKPPHMKNIPYEAISINQKINLQYEYSEIENFHLINPLNNNALNYYNFYLDKELNNAGEKLTIIIVEPKNENIPLFKGKLTFDNFYKIKEAELTGNSRTADAMLDSLILTQRFSTNNNFNLPYFTSYSFKMNFGGLSFWFNKEITYTNHKINDTLTQPVITSNTDISYELNSDIDIELQRKNYFKIPETAEEKEYNERINKVFVNAPLFRKIFFFFFIDLPPLLFDQPADLFGYNISKFSNIYRFNKVEGHYLGLEKTFKISNEFTNYSNIGYGFASNIFSFENDLLWKYYRVKIKNGIKTLGEFNSLQTFQTLSGLIQHVDNYNYYKTRLINISAVFPLTNNIEISPTINIETKEGINNKTGFSIFNKDKIYTPNYNFTNYQNNFASLSLTYRTNPSHHKFMERNVRGTSSFYISSKINFFDGRLLNSSESIVSFEINSKLYMELVKDIRADISASYFNIKNSKHTSQYRFTNTKQSLYSFEQTLPFYTLEDYQFSLNNYLYLNSKIYWFDFPEILSFRMSFTNFFSYLKSFTTPVQVIQESLNKDFFEYGVGMDGLSFFNLYLVKNNLFPKEVYFKIDLSF